MRKVRKTGSLRVSCKNGPTAGCHLCQILNRTSSSPGPLNSIQNSRSAWKPTAPPSGLTSSVFFLFFFDRAFPPALPLKIRNTCSSLHRPCHRPLRPDANPNIATSRCHHDSDLDDENRDQGPNRSDRGPWPVAHRDLGSPHEGTRSVHLLSPRTLPTSAPAGRFGQSLRQALPGPRARPHRPRNSVPSIPLPGRPCMQLGTNPFLVRPLALSPSSGHRVTSSASLEWFWKVGSLRAWTG